MGGSYVHGDDAPSRLLRHPVDHCLVARHGTSIEDVKVVRSHPKAFAQCRSLLRELGSNRLKCSAPYDRRQAGDRGVVRGSPGRGTDHE